MSDELEAAHSFVADELPAGSDESIKINHFTYYTAFDLVCILCAGDEKPPAYDSLRLAVHQLPQETNTTLICEFCSYVSLLTGTESVIQLGWVSSLPLLSWHDLQHKIIMYM